GDGSVGAGVKLDGATLSSGVGAITIAGQGGSTSLANGVLLTNGALIQSTTGAISITGTGGAAGSNNQGVMMWGPGLPSSSITSAQGAIHVIGQGGNSDGGISMYDGSSITSTGATKATAATITLQGTGGTGGVATRGFEISGASVTS